MRNVFAIGMSLAADPASKISAAAAGNKTEAAACGDVPGSVAAVALKARNCSTCRDGYSRLHFKTVQLVGVVLADHCPRGVTCDCHHPRG